MYSKEEMERLKEEDYILWSDLTGDPVTGMRASNLDGCGAVVFWIVIIIILVWLILI